MSSYRSNIISYSYLAPCQTFNTFLSSKTLIFIIFFLKFLFLHAIISISLYFTFMAMTIKLQYVLSFIIWIFLFLIPFHMCLGIKSNISSTSGKITITGNTKFQVYRNRKILATGFDFTPFLNRHHHSHRHHQDHHHRSHMPKETEIDPRYGVDKRLVPSGPNPLHH
ncbi:hypothetical protein MtrunA17_Chr4g0062601 [Medicago truncatula]|uniref:Clavata3/ESR (CLE) gene family member n=1 Tax=Medicago truncatula TaxID=3880 RepID=A0A396IHQ0_MEDTR|nr:hypothetical protein MtrunA17_Chr4g0062601 [Medicago truncatula]